MWKNYHTFAAYVVVPWQSNYKNLHEFLLVVQTAHEVKATFPTLWNTLARFDPITHDRGGCTPLTSAVTAVMPSGVPMLTNESLRLFSYTYIYNNKET